MDEMTKTISALTAAAIVAGTFACVAPSQAASRLMDSTIEGFNYRCQAQGGTYANDGLLVSCDTPSVVISCEYFAHRQANCEWPGIERPIVVRVIGMLPGGHISSSSSSSNNNVGAADVGGNGGGGNGAGGFQGPKDIKDAPNNDPNPGFDGPKNIQLAP
jgi:hypothetical protein